MSRSVGASAWLFWAARALALCALAMQLAAAAIVPVRAAAASPGFGAPICHSGPATDRSAPSPHRSADCVLCPLCQAVAQAGAVLAPTCTAVPPPAEIAAVALPPPARAPPARPIAAAAYPRGPPSRV